MAVTRFDEKTPEQLKRIVADGTTSFKIFLSYKNFFGVEDGELYQTLALAKQLRVITTAHCENAELVSRLQQALLAEGKTGAEWHEPSRPEAVEAEGTTRFATFLETTGAEGYVVHLSSKPALDAARRAKLRGVRLSVETVLPHFLLDKTLAEQPGVEGMKFIMSPPLRDKRNHSDLWAALEAGLIDTVGTDHCPFDLEQKNLGAQKFTEIPNGLPGIEDRVQLMWSYGVAAGRLDIHRFVDALSTRPARLFGLAPRKGLVQVGADADLVVFDPAWKGKLSVKNQLTNNDYNPFEGWPVTGRAEFVTVRGKAQVSHGEFTGDEDHGRFIARDVRG
jgi:dihydropyrimidinase